MKFIFTVMCTLCMAVGYSRRKYDVENTEEKKQGEDEKHANGNRLVNKLSEHLFNNNTPFVF